LQAVDVAEGAAVTQQKIERISETEEEKELARDLFAEIDINKAGAITQQQLESALDAREGHEELKGALRSLLFSGDSQAKITFDKFCGAFKKLPRVRGERVAWARTLRLEELLARLLPRGDTFDGLQGLKAPLLKDEDLSKFTLKISAAFAAALPSLLFEELERLRAVGTGAAGAVAHVNSKFALDGAFVGQFATLHDFYRGPEALIGTPNPRIEEGMDAEHCRRPNRDTQFTTSNYNVTTTPAAEWEFVVRPRMDGDYPHTPRDRARWKPGNRWKGEHGRDVVPLADVLALAEVSKAAMGRPEVIALRLYTGPTFALYNARLRGFPAADVACLQGNSYETTIFAIASGITKLSRVTGIPPGRRLYRGLGGMLLPRQFWEEFDESRVALAVCVAPAPGTAVGDAERLVVERLKAAMQAAAAAAAAANRPTQTFFDLGGTHLLLSLQGGGSLGAAAGRGIRVVSPPQPCGAGRVRMAVALPVPKVDLTDAIKAELMSAVQTVCGVGTSVEVEDVIEKPRDFKGGGTVYPKT
jgi:hypothetical protein